MILDKLLMGVSIGRKGVGSVLFVLICVHVAIIDRKDREFCIFEGIIWVIVGAWSADIIGEEVET